MGVPGDLTLVDNHGHNQLTVRQILFKDTHDFIIFYILCKIQNVQICICIYIFTHRTAKNDTYTQDMFGGFIFLSIRWMRQIHQRDLFLPLRRCRDSNLGRHRKGPGPALKEKKLTNPRI